MGLSQNFLTHHYSKITVHKTLQDALSQSANTLIINMEEVPLDQVNLRNFRTIILLKAGKSLDYKEVLGLDFLITGQNDNFIVLNTKSSN